MRMMVMVVVDAMMVPVMRRIRKARTRKQTQRNRYSDELGHVSDSNLRDRGLSHTASIPLRRAHGESPRALATAFEHDRIECPSIRVFRATHSN
jgi:hypothetical protein